MTLQSWGAPRRVHAPAATNQSDPEIAVLAGGAFVVVFQTDDGAGTQRIVAQRFDIAGDVDGAPIIIAEGTEGVSLAMPDVAAMPDLPGQFAVSYALSAPNATITEAWLSFVDAAGTVQQSIIASVMAPIPVDAQLDVAVHGNIVQHAFTSIAGGADRQITLSTYEWNGFGISGDTTRTLSSEARLDQTNPAIALGPDGFGVVVFQQGVDLAFRLIDPEGDPVGADRLISTTGAAAPGAQVITLVNGGYLVTYTKEGGGFPSDGLDVYGRIIGPDGSFFTEEVLLNSRIAGDQSNVVAAALSDGRFVTFHYDADFGTYVGQMFDMFARPQGAAYVLPDGAASGAFLASVQQLADGGIAIAMGQEGGDVSVQILDPRAGTMIGAGAADAPMRSRGPDDVPAFAWDDTVRAGHDRGSVFRVDAAGDDVLSGGAGADTFVFRTGSGSDVITDFEVGVDTVRLEQPGLGWPDLEVSQSAAGAVVSYGALGDQITLSGVQAMTLTEADFVFV